MVGVSGSHFKPIQLKQQSQPPRPRWALKKPKPPGPPRRRNTLVEKPLLVAAVGQTGGTPAVHKSVLGTTGDLLQVAGVNGYGTGPAPNGVVEADGDGLGCSESAPGHGSDRLSTCGALSGSCAIKLGLNEVGEHVGDAAMLFAAELVEPSLVGRADSYSRALVVHRNPPKSTKVYHGIGGSQMKNPHKSALSHICLQRIG